VFFSRKKERGADSKGILGGECGNNLGEGGRHQGHVSVEKGKVTPRHVCLQGKPKPWKKNGFHHRQKKTALTSKTMGQTKTKKMQRKQQENFLTQGNENSTEGGSRIP